MGVSFGRQFQVVFEHSLIGIVIMDGTGRIQYVNSAVRSFLQYEENEVVGSFLTRYSHEDDSEFFQTLFAELVEGERDDFQMVSRYKPKSGDAAWWRVDMRSVKAVDQSPFMIAVVDDVTSQKNDEDRLRRGKELAEAATRTKSAFLANMSHEIRTPLHTINAVAELMRETDLDEEQQEYLDQITFAGEVLLGLINDILDFSKIEAGRLQLESISFNPVEMLEEAVEMVSLQAHRKGLEVVLKMDNSIPELVQGDPSRIRQVLVNLVNNATKFTEKGQIVVDAQRRERKDGPGLLIQVRDTGIGIQPEVQNRLFKPFSQVDASMTRKFGGTGLGLSISRDLITMMGGRIGVKSHPGKGSNFWFSLPMQIVSNQVVAYSRPRYLPDALHCLVVDDNTDSSSVIRAILEEWGVSADPVTTSAEALAALKQPSERHGGYGLVLVDLMLPDMDGWQLASQIRDLKGFEDIPLLLMTPIGMSTGEAKMKLLRWFNAYIAKPVTRGDMVRALESVYASDIEELEMVDLGEAPGGDEGSASPEKPRESSALPGGAASGTSGAAAHDAPQVVLVAEDHFVNQQLFQTILEKRGFRVLLASDGLEAVAMAQEHRDIDLVFMDVQMPNLNGYDATTRIRELGITVPIVAVTANALSGDRDRCVRVGMNDYMSKPFKNSDITAVLERLRKSGAFSRDRREGGAPDVEREDPAREEEPREGAVEVPVMDIPAAVEAFMGDVETTRRVTLSFADRLPGQLQTVRDYLAADNYPDARVVAHAIKGGAWNLSCQPMGDAAKTVEDLCAAGVENPREAEQEEPFGVPGDIEEALQILEERIGQFVSYVRSVDFSA